MVDLIDLEVNIIHRQDKPAEIEILDIHDNTLVFWLRRAVFIAHGKQRGWLQRGSRVRSPQGWLEIRAVLGYEHWYFTHLLYVEFAPPRWYMSELATLPDYRHDRFILECAESFRVRRGVMCIGDNGQMQWLAPGEMVMDTGGHWHQVSRIVRTSRGASWPRTRGNMVILDMVYDEDSTHL